VNTSIQYSKSVSESSSEKNWQTFLPWVVFATGILYYCFAYLLRIYPSIMEHHLLTRFSVSVQSFGLLTGFYYMAYVPMQLPVGVTVDRIGARRSLLLGCIIACTGVLIFASTTIFSLGLLGRFMIGLGAAFGYVTALKIASLWLPRKFFATATGFLTGIAMIAGSGIDVYLTHLITTVPFHHVLLFPAYIGVFLFICIFLFVKDKQPSTDDAEVATTRSYGELCHQLWLIIKKPQMWLIGIVGTLLYLPSSVFVDAWEVPYLKSAHGFSAEQAAFGALITLTGWVVSSFASGFLSDKLQTRRLPLMVAAIGATIVSSCILFLPNIHVFFMYTLLFTLGLFCGPHPLCFSLGKENCPHQVSGTAVAFTNFLIMVGGFAQPLIGKLLVASDHQAAAAGANAVYTAHDFSIALSVIPIGLVIAYFILLFIRETFGKQV